MGLNTGKRGFVTIATGKEQYYRLALELLRSYRLHRTDDVPFAIICDRECDQTREFDDVVLLENPHSSYLDKLELFRSSPYDETIFVDADALFLADPAVLWSDFADMGDFCCYGKTLPLESKEGWFRYEQTGEFRAGLKFGVQMHGGMYYFRRTDRCREIFERAIYLAEHYSEYQFAHFVEPADEPVLALSMAVSGCEPCPVQNRIIFAPSNEGRLRVTPEGHLLRDKRPCDAVVLHFATGNTGRFLYRYLQTINESRLAGLAALPKSVYRKLRLECLPLDIKIPLTRRIKRFIKYSVSPETFRRLRKLKNK